MNLQETLRSEGRTNKQKNVLTLKMAGVDTETRLGCLNKLITHADFDLPVPVVHHGLVPRQAALVFVASFVAPDGQNCARLRASCEG